MVIDSGIEIGRRAVELFQMGEDGATALEYGFMVAFVAAALLVGAEILAGGVGNMYLTVRDVVAEKIDASDDNNN